MRRALLVGVALLGCRKAPPMPEPLTDVEVGQERVGGAPSGVTEAVAAGPAIVGPGTWAGDGVSVIVPAGWRAWPRAGDGIVSLVHDTGVEVRIRRPEAPPALGDGCAWTFDDHVGRHRDVPVLFPASTATCLPSDPTAPVVQAWWGGLEGEVVQVEVHYPPGTLALGRDLARAVLGGVGVQ